MKSCGNPAILFQGTFAYDDLCRQDNQNNTLKL